MITIRQSDPKNIPTAKELQNIEKQIRVIMPLYAQAIPEARKLYDDVTSLFSKVKKLNGPMQGKLNGQIERVRDWSSNLNSDDVIDELRSSLEDIRQDLNLLSKN